MNASTVMKRDIGLGIARNTSKKRRRRREVRLPLRYKCYRNKYCIIF
jgi:hypothetical protein